MSNKLVLSGPMGAVMKKCISILCKEDREWIKDMMTTEDNLYVYVISVFKG
jgi:hypothetical protein